MESYHYIELLVTRREERGLVVDRLVVRKVGVERLQVWSSKWNRESRDGAE